MGLPFPFLNCYSVHRAGFSLVEAPVPFVIVIVISKLLKRYSKAKRTRAPAYSRALRRMKRGFPKGVKRSSGPNSRVPGGDRVAVRVGVVEMGRGNDQKGQGRRD